MTNKDNRMEEKRGLSFKNLLKNNILNLVLLITVVLAVGVIAGDVIVQDGDVALDDSLSINGTMDVNLASGAGYREGVVDINPGTGIGLHIQPDGVGNSANIIDAEDQFGTKLFTLTGQGVVEFNSLSLPNNNGQSNIFGGFVSYSDSQSTMGLNGYNRRVLTLINDDTTTYPVLQFVRYLADPSYEYQPVASISTNWTNTTSGSQLGELSFNVNDYNAQRTFFKANADGSGVTATYSVDNLIINGNLNVTGCIIYNSTGTPVTLGDCI